MTDYYALLGVKRTATKAEIKKNYRLLATKYHPDRSNDPNSAPKFIAITEAYDVLNNKKSRTQYDLFTWEKLKREREQKAQDSFTTVVPPRKSTRTRRNDIQRIRSTRYHQQTSSVKKQGLLIMESARIASRYILQIMAISLISAILHSIVIKLPDTFRENIIAGLMYVSVALLLAYTLFRFLKYVYLEFNKDVVTYSIFYKLSRKKAFAISISVFVVMILGYLVLLKKYF